MIITKLGVFEMRNRYIVAAGITLDDTLAELRRDPLPKPHPRVIDWSSPRVFRHAQETALPSHCSFVTLTSKNQDLSTKTSASCEMDSGAALRASVISELQSAIRYGSRRAMVGQVEVWS